MKNVYLFYFVLLSFSLTAQVTQHGPDEVYYTQDIFEGKNSRLFLSTTGGLYYSDNHGDEWKLVNHYMNSIYMDPHFAIDPRTNDLYVAGSQGEIYSSPDNGVTWDSHLVAFPPNDTQSQTLAIAGDTIWVGTRNGLMYFQGRETIKTFTYVPSFEGVFVCGLYVKGKTIIAATQTSGLYKSTDGGVTWNTMNVGLPANFRAYGVKIRPGRSYTYGLDGFFYSDDQGATWHEQTNGLSVKQVNDLAIVGDVLYISSFSYSYVWKLAAGSSTWELIDAGIPDGTGPMECIWADDDEVLVGGLSGIYKRKAGDAEFHRSYKGVHDASWFSEFGMSSDGAIWAPASHTGVYRLKPGESDFQPFTRSVANYGRTQPIRNDTLVVVKDYQLNFYDALTGAEKGAMTYHNVIFAQDYVKAWGETFLGTLQDGVYQYEGSPVWRPINQGMVNLRVANFVFNNNKLWAATEDGLYSRSKDDTSWMRVVFGATETIGIRTLFAEGDLMLIGGLDYNNYMSTNGGTTWSRIAALDNRLVEAFAVHDDRVIASTFPLFVSSPDKQMWKMVDVGPYYATALAVFNDRLFMGTIERGIVSVPISWFDRTAQTITGTTVPSSVAVGTTLTLDASSSSGLPITYTVISGDAMIEDNKLIIHSPGRVVVEAKQEGDDTFLPARKELTFDATVITAIGDEVNELISVYPVPADDYLVVRQSTGSSSARVTLVDVKGRTLLSEHFTGEARLDLSGVGSGMFVIAVTSEGKTMRRRVFKR